MLSVKNIVKQYASHRALDNVSLEVKKGQFLDFLDQMEPEKHL